MLKFTGERIVPEADNCEPNFAEKMRQEHICRYYFAAQTVKGKKALDVGCGVGYGSKILSKAGALSVDALDISEEAIKHAKTYYGGTSISYHCASATNFDFGEHLFDVVTCFELIEHVKEQEDVIRCIIRALKPNGVLFISTPRPLEQKRGEFHVHELSLMEFKTLLNSYFSHIDLWFENNHFTSLVTNKQPRNISHIEYMYDQFAIEKADYFLCVASRTYNSDILFPTLIINNDDYVKLLERDTAVLYKSQDYLLNELSNLRKENENMIEDINLLKKKIYYSEFRGVYRKLLHKLRLESDLIL